MNEVTVVDNSGESEDRHIPTVEPCHSPLKMRRIRLSNTSSVDLISVQFLTLLGEEVWNEVLTRCLTERIVCQGT